MPSDPDHATLTEVFRSFQGEGLYVGAPQLFVRFGRCHLRCVYCDTPGSWEPTETCSVFGRPEPNPIPRDRFLEVLRDALAAAPVHSITLTGGEPVLQSRFLERALPEVRRWGLPVHLDTSGTRPEDLARVIDLVDVVALDLKLPATPGVRAGWDEIEACARLAARREGFVKIVLVEESSDAEVERAADLLARAAPRVPVFLQPATPVNDRTHAPSAEALARWRRCFERRPGPTFVTPQVHVLLGWR